MACEHNWVLRNGLFRNWLVCNECETRWPAKGGSFILFLGFSVGNAIFPWILEWTWPIIELAINNDPEMTLVANAIWLLTVLACMKLLNILHFCTILLWDKKETWL